MHVRPVNVFTMLIILSKLTIICQSQLHPNHNYENVYGGKLNKAKLIKSNYNSYKTEEITSRLEHLRDFLKLNSNLYGLSLSDSNNKNTDNLISKHGSNITSFSNDINSTVVSSDGNITKTSHLKLSISDYDGINSDSREISKQMNQAITYGLDDKNRSVSRISSLTDSLPSESLQYKVFESPEPIPGRRVLIHVFRGPNAVYKRDKDADSKYFATWGFFVAQPAFLQP